ncbi:hypothetical protein DPMN_053077 [Dreissena polymorpha]|uniref:DZANK-type domain-containing protein n=1 Tax=Dreissena polymorpha TaxID=45954 RepID=A0A9D4HQC2_DREPO|nr:hypothetical protein DPMN_053077 [Dreissena polymorpha]
MKCPNPGCRAETESSEEKFCGECGQKLQQKAEFIICTGKDEGGKPCGAKIKAAKKFCSTCGRKVDPNEFLIGNCQKCGAECPVSDAMCMECLTSNITGKVES